MSLAFIIKICHNARSSEWQTYQFVEADSLACNEWSSVLSRHITSMRLT